MHTPVFACSRWLATSMLLSVAAVAPAVASNALATQHGCLGCHAKATQLVGPSYQAVAAKYAGQADAAKELAARIRAGGSGRWGDTAMPPQPGVKEADARKLAQWIMASPK